MAKVMISIPDELLAQLDAEAEARHMSLQCAHRTCNTTGNHRPDAARVDQLLTAARKALANTGSWSAEDVIADQRISH